MFVVNLAIADFVMMAKTPIFIYNSFNLGYALGHFGCQIFGVMGSLSGITQATTNLCIAFDRYRYEIKTKSISDLKKHVFLCFARKK